MTTAKPSSRPATTPYLTGDLAVWLIILAEMLAFGIFFLVFALARVNAVSAFNADQATLDLRFGGINTALLISASVCVVLSIYAVQACRQRLGLAWLTAALVGGGCFVVLKLLEYSAKWAAGIDLSSSTFYMFYFLLTGFHFFHVLAGMTFLIFVGLGVIRKGCGPEPLYALKTAGVFWHMVDLLWIVLFPLVYVMR